VGGHGKVLVLLVIPDVERSEAIRNLDQRNNGEMDSGFALARAPE
jgi:hypothetical protein